jgi:hypothetical protein
MIIYEVRRGLRGQKRKQDSRIKLAGLQDLKTGLTG